MFKNVALKFIPVAWVNKVTSDGFRKYFRNTGWLFFGKLLSMVVAFFVGAYVARYLGPTGYGYISYAISFVGLFAPLAYVGIDNVLIKELVNEKPEGRNKLLGTAYIMKIVGSLLAMFLIVLFSFILKNDGLNKFLIIVYSFTLFFQTFSVVDLFFQSQVLSKKTVKIQIVAMIFSAVSKLFFICLGLGVKWFIFSYLLDSMVLGIGLLLSYQKYSLNFLHWKFDKEIFKSLLSQSWPLILTSVAIFVYMKIDQIMIKQMMDETAVGLYSAIVRICEVWYFIPVLICASIFPAMVNIKRVDKKMFKKRQMRLYTLMFWMAILCSLGIIIFGPWIIGLLFGKAYLSSIPALRWYTWANIQVFLGVPLGQYLILEKKNVIYFCITLIGALANVGLNFFLIPVMGITGAALATCISYFSVILSLGLFKSTRNHLVIIFRSILFKTS